jgi:4-hydroxybenzoate polyprenyltransferase
MRTYWVTDLWRVLRVHNLLIAMAGVVAGGWIGLETVSVPKLLVFAAVSALGLGAAGNVANDLRDAAADRVNRPTGERPVAAGRMTRETGHLLVWLGTLGGLGAAALVSGRLVAAGLAALIVMLIYSPWLKRYGPPGNLAVAGVAGLPPFYGALAVGHPTAGVVPWVLAACLHLGREIVKDVEDELGDRVLDRRTIPIRWGRRTALHAVMWTCLAFIPLSVVLPWWAGYDAVYFAVAAPAQALVVLAVLRVRRERFAAASLLLKTAMVIGLGALVLGKVT